MGLRTSRPMFADPPPSEKADAAASLLMSVRREQGRRTTDGVGLKYPSDARPIRNVAVKVGTRKSVIQLYMCVCAPAAASD